MRAAIELKRANPMRAVELLAPVELYEAGLCDRLMAAYLRGGALERTAELRSRSG
jgi:hypothetical protein